MTITECHVLIEFEGRIILVTQSSIYECNKSNLSKWTIIQKKNTFNSITVRPIIKDRSVFFSDHMGDIYKFDIDSCEVNCIAGID